MTIAESMKIIDELSVLKFFPTLPAARAALAGKLIEWCDGKLERARWLADQVDTISEYPGPQKLAEMVRGKFRAYESTYTPQRIAELRIEFIKAGHLDLLAELNRLWGPR